MGQIWAALKSLGAIAALISELLGWVRELVKKRQLDKADETHSKNAADIDAAFSGDIARPVMRVPQPTGKESGEGTAGSPGVSGGAGSGTGVVEKGP